jgi:hypothetical protein
LVAPLVAFAGLTVAALVKQIVADYTANMAKKALAHSFLIERIDKKLERKFGKNFIKQKLDDEKLEKIRTILHEELSAFSPKKDIDQLIVNSVQKLSDEHQLILAKLDKVESLLEKISIPMAYSLAKESERDIPEELLTGLFEGSLQGHNSSNKVLRELTENNIVPIDVYDGLKSYKFIQHLSKEGDTEINHLVKKFAYSPEEINTLSTLIDISTLLTGPTKEIENIVSDFVFKMISEGLNTSVIEDSVISFCFIIHRLGKLDKISRSDKLLLGSFLRESVKKIEDSNRVLEAYFLLSNMDMASDISTDFIKDILERQQKQGIGTTHEMTGQVRITGRMARFLRRLGIKTTKPKTSIRTINLLIRKLDKRKFTRSTQLLKYQLERLTSEINILNAYFEKEEPSRVELDELIELLKLLLEILNRPKVYQLDLDTRKLVLELMDAAYYLYDLLAIRNSWNLLNSYQLDVKSLYSPTLGNYQRIITDESAFNRSLSNYSIKRVQKVDKALPSPPKRKERQKIGE